MEWTEIKTKGLPDYFGCAFLCAQQDEWMDVCYMDMDYTRTLDGGEFPVFTCWRRECDDEVVYPTHWMKLPEMPFSERLINENRNL